MSKIQDGRRTEALARFIGTNLLNIQIVAILKIT